MTPWAWSMIVAAACGFAFADLTLHRRAEVTVSGLHQRAVRHPAAAVVLAVLEIGLLVHLWHRIEDET